MDSSHAGLVLMIFWPLFRCTSRRSLVGSSGYRLGMSLHRTSAHGSDVTLGSPRRTQFLSFLSDTWRRLQAPLLSPAFSLWGEVSEQKHPGVIRALPGDQPLPFLWFHAQVLAVQRPGAQG